MNKPINGFKVIRKKFILALHFDARKLSFAFQFGPKGFPKAWSKELKPAE